MPSYICFILHSLNIVEVGFIPKNLIKIYNLSPNFILTSGRENKTQSGCFIKW